MEAIPEALDAALQTQSWRDAYVLQEVSEKYGGVIDHNLQRDLGNKIIQFGCAGLEQILQSDEKTGIKPAELITLHFFMRKHTATYPISEEWLVVSKAAMAGAAVSFMDSHPWRALYEFIDIIQPIGSEATAASTSYLIDIVNHHPERGLLPDRFKANVLGAVYDAHSALELVRLGFFSGLLTRKDVCEVYEAVLEAVEIKKLVQSSAAHDHRTFGVGTPETNYWMSVTPRSMGSQLESILPGATARAEEVISRRRIEVVNTMYADIKDQPGELEE